MTQEFEFGEQEVMTLWNALQTLRDEHEREMGPEGAVQDTIDRYYIEQDIERINKLIRYLMPEEPMYHLEIEETPDGPVTQIRRTDDEVVYELYLDEPEVECAHCGGIPDGAITIDTDEFQRHHRICNKCARETLEWL